VSDNLSFLSGFFTAKLIVRSTCFGAPLCPSSGAQDLYRCLLPVVLGAVKMENEIYKFGNIGVL